MFSQQQLQRAINRPPPDAIRDLRDGRPRQRPDRLPGNGRIGAVLLLLYVDRQVGSQHIVLTKRRHTLKHHPGQISLPGGQQEPGESLEMTSLRESQEEIGIQPQQISIIGQLNNVYIPPSDYTITPFVGWCEAPIQFVKCRQEVEQVLLVDLIELMEPENLRFGTIASEQRELDASFFAVGEHQVWGATAVVINEFIELIRRDCGSSRWA